MTFCLKLLGTTICAAALLFSGLSGAWADPFQELTPDQNLYQRVKKLGDYGLLDPQDKAVLDQGKVVTRLELAFYTEKAKARIEAPQLLEVQPSPTPQSLPLPVVQPPLPAATPPPNIPPGEKEEIEELLKELHAEAGYLRTRLSLDDQRVKEQEDELDQLKKVQDEVDETWKNANKSVGIPNFNTNMYTQFENINTVGLASNSITRINEALWLGMYTDLGGKGTLSLGLGAVLPYSNFSGVSPVVGVGSEPVSFYVGNPSATFYLYGDLGKWDTSMAVETYQPDTTYGYFTRGYANNAVKRFEDPFDVKNFNDDKNAKNWDDYMDSISYVPAYSPSAGNVQSANDRVFDGLYTAGRQLPWLGPDGRMWFLVGRMGTTQTQTQRWEEGAKIMEPWANNLIDTSLATEWVNDNFGVNTSPQLDLKSYEADVKLNLNPVLIDIDGGFSHFYTGLEYAGPAYISPTTPGFNAGSGGPNAPLANPKPLEAGAGQASIAFYPLTLYGFAISDSYANFQSKITMSGINFTKYGLSFNPSDYNDVYGSIGEVDQLQSDRYGWRLNLGWDGRKQDWMKNWPSFFDTFVINFDVAQKSEYVDEQNPFGYSMVEPTQILSFYYPDDEGLWGLNLWGNYAPNVNPMRQDYINNIESVRNDGDLLSDDVRYQFRMSNERLPLILPVFSAPGVIMTNASGQNVYYNVTNLKSYDYITLTTKLKINQWINLPTPLDGSFFMTDNKVSGSAANANLNLPAGANPAFNSGVVQGGNISNLFEQKVFSGALMVNLVDDLDLMADMGVETWKSAYSYPQVDYQTNEFGLGVAYDIPWGGGKMEWRYKHIDFVDHDLKANNYSGDQIFCKVKFLF